MPVKPVQVQRTAGSETLSYVGSLFAVARVTWKGTLPTRASF